MLTLLICQVLVRRVCIDVVPAFNVFGDRAHSHRRQDPPCIRREAEALGCSMVPHVCVVGGSIELTHTCSIHTRVRFGDVVPAFAIAAYEC